METPTLLISRSDSSVLATSTQSASSRSPARVPTLRLPPSPNRDWKSPDGFDERETFPSVDEDHLLDDRLLPALQPALAESKGNQPIFRIDADSVEEDVPSESFGEGNSTGEVQRADVAGQGWHQRDCTEGSAGQAIGATAREELVVGAMGGIEEPCQMRWEGLDTVSAVTGSSPRGTTWESPRSGR